MLVQIRRIRSIQCVDICANIIDLNANQFGRIHRFFHAIGEYDSDRLADIADLSAGEMWLRRRAEGPTADPHQRHVGIDRMDAPRDVIGHPHPDHAGGLPGVGYVHLAQVAVRHVRAQNMHKKNSFWLYIVDVAARAREEPDVLATPDRLANSELHCVPLLQRRRLTLRTDHSAAFAPHWLTNRFPNALVPGKKN
nr:hypothetical protein [Pontivivens ytuae]